MTNFDEPVDPGGTEPVISDRWMRIFIAVIDAGSFTGAARRLGIGQPAVSHAIKRLEGALGVRLFERNPTGLTVTDVGAELKTRTETGYRLVDDAVDAARGSARRDHEVALSVSTALAAYWLMPRLSRFKAAHPGVDLSVITQDTDRSVGDDGADLWIPLGPGPFAGTRTWRFADEQIVAVASPEYVRRADFAFPESARLIHLDERYGKRYDWPRWFAESGLPFADHQIGQRSNDYSVVVHAAMESQGVALGWVHIVGPLIDAGRLVTVTDDVRATDNPFVLAQRRDAPPREPVELVRRWLLAEAGRSASR